MQHGDGIAGEQPAQRPEIDGQRVDQRRFGVDGELHERQLWKVGALAVELSVEGVSRLGNEHGR